MLKAFSCGIEEELRNTHTHTQAQQGKTNHCQINVLLNYYRTFEQEDRTHPPHPNTHTHTPYMKIFSIWLYASSLFPKASFPAGSLREQKKEGERNKGSKNTGQVKEKGKKEMYKNKKSKNEKCGGNEKK